MPCSVRLSEAIPDSRRPAISGEMEASIRSGCRVSPTTNPTCRTLSTVDPDSLRGRSLAFPYGERRENASFAMFGLVDFEVVCVDRKG